MPKCWETPGFGVLVVAPECTAYAGVGEVMKPAVVGAVADKPTTDCVEPRAKTGSSNALVFTGNINANFRRRSHGRPGLRRTAPPGWLEPVS